MKPWGEPEDAARVRCGNFGALEIPGKFPCAGCIAPAGCNYAGNGDGDE